MSKLRNELTVVEYQKVTNPNKSTSFEEVVVLENIPCKLSFTTIRMANQTETEAKVVLITKLFLDNRVDIKPGSKLIVQRRDRIFEFGRSGEPGIFTAHQEIMLELFKGWA